MSKNRNDNIAINQEWYDVVPYSGNVDFIKNAIDYMTNSQNPISVLAKKDLYQTQHLVSIFKEKTLEKFSNEEIEIISSLAETNAKIQDMTQKLKQQKLIPSLKITQELEALQRTKTKLDMDLLSLTYKQQTSQQNEFNFFVFNCLLLSLGFVLLVLIIQMMFAYKQKRKIRGYFND